MDKWIRLRDTMIFTYKVAFCPQKLPIRRFCSDAADRGFRAESSELKAINAAAIDDFYRLVTLPRQKPMEIRIIVTGFKLVRLAQRLWRQTGCRSLSNERGRIVVGGCSVGVIGKGKGRHKIYCDRPGVWCLLDC